MRTNQIRTYFAVAEFRCCYFIFSLFHFAWLCVCVCHATEKHRQNTNWNWKKNSSKNQLVFPLLLFSLKRLKATTFSIIFPFNTVNMRVELMDFPHYLHWSREFFFSLGLKYVCATIIKSHSELTRQSGNDTAKYEQ